MGRRRARLCRTARVVDRRAGAVLAFHVGFRRDHRGRAGRAHRDRRRQDAGRPLVPRREAQLRREPAAPAGRGGRAGLLGRGPRQAAPRLRRPARPGLAHDPGACGPWRAPGGPGRGLPAEHAGDHRLGAGGREPRRGLVLVLVGLRHARRARPLRPDRAQGADRRRRLLLQRQGLRPPAAGAGNPGRASQRRARNRGALRGGAPFARRHPGRRPLRRGGWRAAGRADRLRARALRPPAGDHVLLGHHRRAEMHRARHRRHAAAAHEGACAPQRHRAGRPRVLRHHLRLDDVELAGERARLGGDPPALRRLALPSRRQRALRLCRRRGHDAFRHLRQVLGRRS